MIRIAFCLLFCAMAMGATKPESKNFDTYDQYVDAMTDWKIAQGKTERPAPIGEFQGWLMIGQLAVITFLIYSRMDRSNKYLEDFASRLPRK